MLIPDPPCQTACVQLVWEGNDGGLNVQISTENDEPHEIYREGGITLESIVNEVCNMTCTVDIEACIDTSKYGWSGYGVIDTTMYDQIALFESQHSTLKMRISDSSRIYLQSTVAPTEYEYKKMARNGHVVAPINGVC